MEEIKGYNIRVYGLLIDDSNQLLLSNEKKGEMKFTKFPGGGHEFGEGLKDCLIREFREELGIEVEIQSHFYTTDFFQRSVFDKSEQLVSIYYLVKSKESGTIEDGRRSIDSKSDEYDHFNWKKMNELRAEDLTFPIDQRVVEILLNRD